MENKTYWDTVVTRIRKKNYLDKVLAQQKKEAYLRLIDSWIENLDNEVILKTDMFEEIDEYNAFFPALKKNNRLIGMDISWETLKIASADNPGEYVNCDVRQLPFKDNSLGIVISPSTLDHFAEQEDMIVSLKEIRRVLKNEGILFLTLDNKNNIFYFLLKIISALRISPFRIGRTFSIREADTVLKELGYRVEREGVMIHNPRVITSLLVFCMRKLFKSSDRAVKNMLSLVARLKGRKTEYLTGCFIALKAVKIDR